MKRNKGHWTLAGLLMVAAGMVWTGLRSVPFVGYRYDHPKMTDTELQIYFLSQLCWWDLAPAFLFAAGMFLLYYNAEK